MVSLHGNHLVKQQLPPSAGDYDLSSCEVLIGNTVPGIPSCASNPVRKQFPLLTAMLLFH